MRKKPWILFGLAALIFTATVLVAGRPTPEAAVENSVCCKMKAQQECLKKQQANNPGGIIMDNLPHQFLLINSF